MKSNFITTTELVDRLKAILKIKSEQELAEYLSMSPSSLSMRKSRNGSILQEVLLLAKQKNLDLNGLLLGREEDTDLVTLHDEKGVKARDIFFRKKFFESRNLNPDTLFVFRQENGNIHFVDSSINKITTPGIYLINTENGALLKHATIRLDGSILFPSHTDVIPAEVIEKTEVPNLQIIGRSVLTLAPTD